MVDPASCYTDGSHRFWYDNMPVAQVYRHGEQFVLVSLDSNIWIDIYDDYPTVDEVQASWEDRSK